jgi:hypothetical protein
MVLGDVGWVIMGCIDLAQEEIVEGPCERGNEPTPYCEVLE